MRGDVEAARRHIADEQYRKAIKVLWRIEARARTDLAAARELRELASACQLRTGGRLQHQCDLLIGYADAAIARHTAPPAPPPRPSVPEGPAPLEPLPSTSGGAQVTVVLRAWGYDVATAGRAVGRIEPDVGIDRALITAARARWRLDCRAWKRSWRGVAETADGGAAVAAYYPNLLGGGELALADRSCRLRQRHLRGGWRLRDDDGAPLARFSIAATAARAVTRLEAQLDPAFALQPDQTFLLLFAIWAVLVEHALPKGSGGGAGP